MKRYAAKRDGNEPAIVEALERVGCSVIRLSEVDLLVGLAKRTFLLEVKTDKGRLTDSQEDMVRTWRGHYEIVRSVDEALRAVGLT